VDQGIVCKGAVRLAAWFVVAPGHFLAPGWT
jgi:hypothetical protein